MNLGTLVYTFIKGSKVGVDQLGNRYYKSKGKKLNNRERRWVLYKGQADASVVPGEWHAWLHHTTENPLIEEAIQAPSWRQEHIPNLTGTSNAYLPVGHEYQGGKRNTVVGDYEAWVPEE